MTSSNKSRTALLELAHEKLSANNMKSGLPGRESQHEMIYNFLFERLKIRHSAAAKRARVDTGEVTRIKGKHLNKSIFICGVPGTGKTATVMSVEHKLKKLLERQPCPIHNFETVYINGQHLSGPEKLYTEILLKLSGETCSPEAAQDKLDKIFKSSGAYVPAKRKKFKTVADSYKIIIVDELDTLYNEKKQSVFYSLFDWPTSSDSKMLLIAIANAMDLPERFMRGRITSRLGWEKAVFESYTSDCLENILRTRLGEELLQKTFDKNAVLVATKRIGRTTGDARRILDTCRLAIDQAIRNNLSKVTTAIVDQVGFQNLDIQRRDYVLECSKLELIALKSILQEADRVGEENVEAEGVYTQMRNTLKLATNPMWKSYILGYSELRLILRVLAAVGLIYLENDKPILKKGLYIKDNAEVFKDLIKTTKVKF